MLDRDDDPIEYQPEQRDQPERGKDRRRLQGHAARNDERAKAALRSDELTDDRPQPAHRRGELQAGEDVRHGVRKADFHEYLPAARAQAAHEVEHFGLGVASPTAVLTTIGKNAIVVPITMFGQTP